MSTLSEHLQYCECDDCRAERNALQYERNHPNGEEQEPQSLQSEDVEVADYDSDFGGTKIYWKNKKTGEHFIAYEIADWWMNRGDPVVKAARKKYGYKD